MNMINQEAENLAVRSWSMAAVRIDASDEFARQLRAISIPEYLTCPRFSPPVLLSPLPISTIPEAENIKLSQLKKEPNSGLTERGKRTQ